MVPSDERSENMNPVPISHLLATRMVSPGGLQAEKRISRLLIRDLVLLCRIGAYPEERLAPQRVRINVEIRVREADRPLNDDIDNVLSYDRVVTAIKERIGRGHINLVETLAEDIVDLCFADHRAEEVRVRVEKLDIIPEAAAVGVEIERSRPPRPAAASIYPLPQVVESALGKSNGQASSDPDNRGRGDNDQR